MGQEEYIRSVLNPGEKIVYRAVTPSSAYLAPVGAIFLGVSLHFMPSLFAPILETGIGDIFAKFLDGAGQTYFGLAIIVMGIAVAFQVYYRQKYHINMVTSQRVLALSGAMIHKKDEIYLYEIVGVVVGRSMFERMLMQGRLVIKGNDRPEHEIKLSAIADPKLYAEHINQSISRFSALSKEAKKNASKK